MKELFERVDKILAFLKAVGLYKKNLNLQYSLYVHDANTRQPNQEKLSLNNLKST